MSVVYCENCNKQIDTDYNAEHFDYDTGKCTVKIIGQDEKGFYTDSGYISDKIAINKGYRKEV